MSKKKNPEEVVREIKRKTRRRFSAKEKTRIVLEGLRGLVGPRVDAAGRILANVHGDAGVAIELGRRDWDPYFSPLPQGGTRVATGCRAVPGRISNLRSTIAVRPR